MNSETNTEASEHDSSSAAHNDENRWVVRFEELLKVKNFDDLKSELQKIAGEVQTEIQHFDLNSHLSPMAKGRLKKLEQRYTEVAKLVAKAQKQIDREFNKSIRVIKQTRQDAEKQMRDIRAKVVKHRVTFVKASQTLKSRLQGKKTVRKVRKTKKA